MMCETKDDGILFEGLALSERNKRDTTWCSKSQQNPGALTGCDAKTAVNIVHESEDGGIKMDLHPVGRDEAHEGNKNDEGCVEPVDVLVPVRPGHGRIGDVDLLGIMLGTRPKRDVIGGAIIDLPLGL